MSYYIIFLTALSLSMDAFAVAVSKGLAMQKATIKSQTIVGLWFGFFQGLMPFIGYMLASIFSKYIEKFDYWIAFILLSFIGLNMIKEALSKDDENSTGASLSPKIMFVMAIATSIDALAVGVSFISLSFIKMLISVLIIGVSTFVISFIGVKIGNIFGNKYKSKAELAGGIILILIGIKLLLEGL
jgi:putative Mn2+ efflux pump MntP